MTLDLGLVIEPNKPNELHEPKEPYETNEPAALDHELVTHYSSLVLDLGHWTDWPEENINTKDRELNN